MSGAGRSEHVDFDLPKKQKRRTDHQQRGHRHEPPSNTSRHPMLGSLQERVSTNVEFEKKTSNVYCQ